MQNSYPTVKCSANDSDLAFSQCSLFRPREPPSQALGRRGAFSEHNQKLSLSPQSIFLSISPEAQDAVWLAQAALPRDWVSAHPSPERMTESSGKPPEPDRFLYRQSRTASCR